MTFTSKFVFSTLAICTLISCGGGGSQSPMMAPPAPPAAENIPPRIQFPLTESFNEGSEGVAFTFTSTDGDRDDRTHTITGPDSAFFDLSAPQYDGTRADLSFIILQAQDFENPSDANADGIFEVTVTVDDGQATHSVDAELMLLNRGAYTIENILPTTTGLVEPIQIVGYSGTRAIILEKAGRVMLETTDAFPSSANVMLDLSDQISSSGERGLLGGVLSESFEDDGIIYLHFTNLDGNIEVRRYSLVSGRDDTFDLLSEEKIITVERPRANHNAGWIGFAPDGTLWIPTGDSGGANDPDNLAQDAFSLQGKVLRLDLSSDDFPADTARNYSIPADNPFQDGVNGAPEVFALGLRNPFRAAIDPLSGELYIGDVGQGMREEINRLSLSTPGLNFGWPLFEGLLANTGSDSTGLTPPILEYSHTGNRGSIILGGIDTWETPSASESFLLFSDFFSGETWFLQPDLLSPDETISAAQFDSDNIAALEIFPTDSRNYSSYTIARDVFEATDISTGEIITFEPPLPL